MWIVRFGISVLPQNHGQNTAIFTGQSWAKHGQNIWFYIWFYAHLAIEDRDRMEI